MREEETRIQWILAELTVLGLLLKAIELGFGLQ